MNPTWSPPEEAEKFIHEVKEKARHHEDTVEQEEVDRHSEALESVSVGVSCFILQLMIWFKIRTNLIRVKYFFFS